MIAGNGDCFVKYENVEQVYLFLVLSYNCCNLMIITIKRHVH